MSRRPAASAAEQDALAAEYGVGPSQGASPYGSYGYGYGYGNAYGSYGYGRSSPYAAAGAASSPYAGVSTASPYGGASSAASPYAAGGGASTARGTWGSYAQQRTAEDLEEGNDARIEGLSARVKLLRDITSGIGSEAREGNTDLSSLVCRLKSCWRQELTWLRLTDRLVLWCHCFALDQLWEDDADGSSSKRVVV